MKKTRPVHVFTETYKLIKKEAEEKGLTIGQVVDAFTKTAISKRAAVEKWKAKQ